MIDKNDVELMWSEEFDEHDNTMWVLPSPYTDECGSPLYYFRIKQSYRNNEVEYVEHSDGELIDRYPRIWGKLKHAMNEIVEDYLDIVKTSKEDYDSTTGIQ